MTSTARPPHTRTGRSPRSGSAKLEIANAWCAAFMWHKTKDAPPAITYDVFQALKRDEPTLLAAAVSAEVDRLRDEYGFFHWHLEFPDIFRVPDGEGAGIDPNTGWAGGFTCLLGNPPWDKVDFKDKEYFSVVEPSIAALAGQKRRDRIKEWEREHPEEGMRYRAARRRVKSTFLFASGSGMYPNCAPKGSRNRASTRCRRTCFSPSCLHALAAPIGRVGCIIPTAIATGAGGQHLFRCVHQAGRRRFPVRLREREAALSWRPCQL